MRAINITWLQEEIKYIVDEYIDVEDTKEARKEMVKEIKELLKFLLVENDSEYTS